MKKVDLNDCMLFKLESDDLGMVMTKLNQLTMYNKSCIKLGKLGGLVNLDRYKDNLTHVEFKEFDIIAIKQFEGTNEVLYHVLNDKEPDSWDWIREENKEVKSVKLPICVKNIVKMLREDI